jgi:hypothetical protein
VTEKNVDLFRNDPIAYFEGSITKMHSIAATELDALQREAMRRRFAEHRDSIEMLRNSAST